MLEKFNADTLKGFRWTVGWSWLRRFGVEYSRVEHHGSPYLTRWIVYLGGGTLRLHKFWRGDDDRASHTHPWWFVTIPLRTYREDVFKQGRYVRRQEVKAFRPHFRAALYEHVVVNAKCICSAGYNCKVSTPFYTIVISGAKSNEWGFYPEPGKFVPWRDFIHTYESKQ